MNVTPHNFWMPLKILLAVADYGTRRGKGFKVCKGKREPLMNGNVNWFYQHRGSRAHGKEIQNWRCEQICVTVVKG